MVSVPILEVLAIVATIAAVLIVLAQCRRPRWLPGHVFVWLMNRTHARVTLWGQRHVTIPERATILDIGCGGGRTVPNQAGPGRKVWGVDDSAASVAAAKRTSADLIAAGQVDIRHAGVSRLPFGDATFDLVPAVETHYHWPDPVRDVHEVLRVLKRGRTLPVAAETSRNQAFSVLLVMPMLLLRARYSTLDEHRALFFAADFTDIEIQHVARKGWICCVARRPAA